MRIGFIVDGDSEVSALPLIFRRIRTPHELLPTIVRGQIHPKADVARIARATAEACQYFARRQVDLVIVLIDLEDRSECPAALKDMLQPLIVGRLARIGLKLDVEVVIKVTKLENWLIADDLCLRQLPGLFPDINHVGRRRRSTSADNLDALDILKRATGSRQAYPKVKGAVAICTHMDPARAARNSRSFRRLLRVLEDERYLDQSRLPSPEA